MSSCAVLTCGDQVHVLSSKTTTIGHDGCDIIIDDCGAEKEHAIIEYCAHGNSFVLHDLNTTHGTYVNDCRIQNAAVKLAMGDVIKFGYAGKPHKLDTYMGNFNDPSRSQRWQSPVQIVVSSPRHMDCYQEASSLPLINGSSSASPHLSSAQRSSCVQPHPPIRARPLSASAVQQSISAPTYLPNSNQGRCSKEAWISTESLEQSIHEKDQKLLAMGDELNRLAVFEQESKRKDATICSLRKENAQLHENLMKNQQYPTSKLCHKLQTIDSEVVSRRNEVNCLQRQLDSFNTKFSSSPTLTSQLAEKEKKIHELRQDLDKFKKEYGMSQGLVQSLQRELQAKEATLQKKNEEIDHVKKSLKQKEIQLSSISAKFTKITDDKSKDELIETLKKETKDLKLKIRASESRAADQVVLLQTYKEEISKLKSTTQSNKEEKDSAVKELESFKQKFYELQRSERILRVDLEQSKSRLDRFRLRIVRTLYSTPEIKAPDDEENVEDGTVIGDIKKLSDQCIELRNKMRSLRDDVHEKDSALADVEHSQQSCKTAINDMISRVSSNGHHIRLLQQEMQVLSSLPIDQSMVWVRDSVSSILDSEIKWLTTLDQVLVSAGYDTLLSGKNPGEHVSHLHDTLKREADAHKVTLQSIAELEKKHREELHEHVNKILLENEDKLAAEIEKMRLEEKARYSSAVEDLKLQEENKRVEALLKEREKVNSANNGVEQLQKTLAEKSAEEAEYKAKIGDALQMIEAHKTAENKLANELAEVEKRYKVELTVLKDRMHQAQDKFSFDEKQYKEEIHQHSITIVSLEEQLKKLTSEQHLFEGKIKELRDKLKDSSNIRVRTPPTPPQAVVDVQGMEQTIALLKSQLLHANHQIHIQQDAIIGLKRDLSGAQARISDMTGELSESQKQELEHNRHLVKNQEVELNAIRQQLLKMTSVVDSQKDTVKSLQQQLKDSQAALAQNQNEAAQQKSNASELALQLECEKTKVEKTKKEEQKEGRIASELTSIGAVCRGERHEDVISRQREALAELRARVKALEQIRPPLPSQEQALQQVILLKKELAEIRAKQAMDEDQHTRAQMSMSKEALDAEQQIRSATTQASIERTTRENLEESVVQSEKTYMDVMNAVAGYLGINSLQGMRTMQHVTHDERDRLASDRRQDLDLLASRIKAVLQRLDRKEQLLQGYEKDLAKLRDAENFASQKATRVGSLTQELMEKSQEADHLREALNRSREALEIEKRLNKAIKERKTFHLENLDHRQPPPEARSCYTSEFEVVRAENKEKKRLNKMRRKQYEIEVLKQRVRGRERDLCEATARRVGRDVRSTDELTEIYENSSSGSKEADRSL